MEPRSFEVILKKCHLKAKYQVSTHARRRTYQRCHKVTIVLFVISLFLYEAKNIPVDFEQVLDYKQRCMVELQMARKS